MTRPSDVCASCGHERAFHQVGTGQSVALGQAYCDDRHAAPCDCSGFVDIDANDIDVDELLATLDAQFAEDLPSAPTSNLIHYHAHPHDVIEADPAFKALARKLSKEQLLRVMLKISEVCAAEINLRVPPRKAKP